MAHDLPQPRSRDGLLRPWPGVEERLDPGAVLRQVQVHRGGKLAKITDGRLDLPTPKATKKATPKAKPATQKAAPKKRAAATTKKAAKS